MKENLEKLPPRLLLSQTRRQADKLLLSVCVPADSLLLRRGAFQVAAPGVRCCSETLDVVTLLVPACALPGRVR